MNEPRLLDPTGQPIKPPKQIEIPHQDLLRAWLTPLGLAGCKYTLTVAVGHGGECQFVLTGPDHQVMPDVPPAKVEEFLREMTKKLAQEKIKAKVKAGVEAKEKGIGRNDPCPCGSGKKYKACCQGER